MKTVAHAEENVSLGTGERGFAVDTTLVLFFLAVEFGRTLGSFSLDSVVMAITLMMLAVLPYFLPSEEKPEFSNWLFGRIWIAAFAVLIGVLFRQTVGVVLPETFRFMPMTMLILTAMFSCYIQFYRFLRLRTVR